MMQRWLFKCWLPFVTLMMKFCITEHFAAVLSYFEKVATSLVGCIKCEFTENMVATLTYKEGRPTKLVCLSFYL